MKEGLVYTIPFQVISIHFTFAPSATKVPTRIAYIFFQDLFALTEEGDWHCKRWWLCDRKREIISVETIPKRPVIERA
jgi:hypothetical protein